MRAFYIFICLLLATFASVGQPDKYFKIKIVDGKSGRGVPLVELKTTNHLSYYTDNNGIIAFYEPGLMNQEVYFHIKSHGYEYPTDGFGYRGKALLTKPGDSTVIQLKRTNIAERLYRVTGEGLYGNSIRVGSAVPLKEPLLNGKVFGQDTFVETLYKGRMYWFWGDTDRPSYPLGNFATSGATSDMPGKGGLDPSIGLDLHYFVDEKGFSKKMCPLQGPGPVWIHWLTVLKDSTTADRLISSYTRVKNLGEAYEHGLALFHDSAGIFKPFVRFDLNSKLFPEGHSFRAIDKGKEYIYYSFTAPYSQRVLADWKHVTDLSRYEAFTCLQEGSHYDTTAIRLDRGADGALIYGWKTNTDPLDYNNEQFLLKKGELKAGEILYDFRDILTGKPVVPHAGSIFWNDFRRKWISVFHQRGGTSDYGEVWFAEADTPTGPWVYARKIVTHDKYTFYNVGQHPLFDQENGRLIYFEGTYTDSFSGNPVQTPQYNYNQIMYRLDLSDSLLYLPSPVYRLKDKKAGFNYQMLTASDPSSDFRESLADIPFFAMSPDRCFDGLIPVYLMQEKGKSRLRPGEPGKSGRGAKPLFYGCPVKEIPKPQPEGINGIWECDADGFSLKISLRTKGDLVEGTTGDESVIIQKGILRKDTLELFLDDKKENQSYVVKVHFTTSILNGEFWQVDENQKKTFSGKRASTFQKEPPSPMVVPLYEYRDKDGCYSYSVKPGKEGLARSEIPVCRVWENPSQLINFDFGVKPVPLTRP